MAKILIIEDAEALLTMLSNKLKTEGYEVLGAQDGEEGLAAIKKEKPDLILLDIIMPKLSGMELLEIMHGEEKLKNIPVIIISNSGQPVEIERAKTLGIKDYLIKAEFDPEEVVEKVKNVLEGSSSAKDSTASVAKNNASQGSKEVTPTGPLRSEASRQVLVVEDDQFLCELIVKKLNEEGLQTIQAIDGEEGLRMTREKKPAIVLLDLILPGIDGFEVLRQIKADPSMANVPVVILSNLGQRDDIDRGLKLGAEDYLIKAHFTPGEIVQKVKEILSERSPEGREG